MSNKLREELKNIDFRETFLNHTFDNDLKELVDKIGKIVNKSKTNHVADLYIFSSLAKITMEKIGENLPNCHKKYKEDLSQHSAMSVLYAIYMMHETTHAMYEEYSNICKTSFNNLDPIFKEIYLDFLIKEAKLLNNRSIFLQKIISEKVFKNNAE